MVGFSQESSNSCVDEDECVTGNHQCAQATCQNRDWVRNRRNFQCHDCSELCVIEFFEPYHSVGSYSCVCFEGYEKFSETECVDVNECELSICGLDQECQNEAGSYYCNCSAGWIFDNKTCIGKTGTRL